MLFVSRRGFAYNFYNYSSNSNPRVYFTVSKGGRNIGDLVFELYQNQVPRTVEHITSFVTGNNSSGASYSGTKLEKGQPGFVIQGGTIEGASIEQRFIDENLNLRHYKRGQLTLAN